VPKEKADGVAVVVAAVAAPAPPRFRPPVAAWPKEKPVDAGVVVAAGNATEYRCKSNYMLKVL
jgi:hypothetical protein